MGHNSGFNDGYWITQVGKISPTHRPTTRLICFAFAGGGPSIFSEWRNFLPINVELLAIHLPGRGNRWRDALCSNFKTVILAVLNATIRLAPLPTMYFGHSLGGLLAFALTRELEEMKHQSVPYALVLSGCAPPHIDKDEADGPVWKLDDNRFIQKLRELNGTPEEFLNSPELLDLYLPLLRADFQLADDTRLGIKGQTQVRTIVLGGHEDEITSKELQEWQQYVASQISVRMFSGDHFFLNTNQEAICSIVTSLIKIQQIKPQ